MSMVLPQAIGDTEWAEQSGHQRRKKLQIAFACREWNPIPNISQELCGVLIVYRRCKGNNRSLKS